MEPAKLTPETDTRNVVDKYRGWTNEAIKAHLADHAFAFHIAIENFQHDFNIGTIVRNANAFNAAGVHIVGHKRWNRRGAMVTDRYLQLYHHETPAELAAWANDHSLVMVGVDNIPGSRNLHQADIPRAAMLIMGQEGPGLSADMQRRCQYLVAVEQFGSTRSVNVGVASGIVMYEWVRRWALTRPH